MLHTCAHNTRQDHAGQPYLPVEAVVALLKGEQEVDGAGQAGDLIFRHRPETAVIERAVITHTCQLTRLAERNVEPGTTCERVMMQRGRYDVYLSKAYWRRPSWRGRVPCVPLQPRSLSSLPSLLDFFHPTNKGLQMHVDND